jgi:hypothetical protein
MLNTIPTGASVTITGICGHVAGITGHDQRNTQLGLALASVQHGLRYRAALRPQYRHHRALMQRLGGPLGEQVPGGQPVLFADADDRVARLSAA